MQPSARSLILDLLSTLRRGSMPVRALVRAGALFGIDDNALRVALARLCTAGQVESLRRGEYRLGAGAEAIQRQVAAWRDPDRRTRRWDGAWIAALAPTPTLARSALRRQARALRFYGLRPLSPALFVRPDNLEGGIAAARERLYSLGADPSSVIFQARDLEAKLEAHARDLWPLCELRSSYSRSQQLLERSRGRLARAGREEAMVETFLLGGRVLRQLALDPLLPDELLDSTDRRALVQAMREYDRFGRSCWADFMSESGVTGSRTPAHGPASDSFAGSQALGERP